MKVKDTDLKAQGKSNGKKMTRSQAIKKAGAITLAAGTMLTILNNPGNAQDIRGSAPKGPGFGG